MVKSNPDTNLAMILGAKPSKEYAIHLQSNAARSDKKKQMTA
jgi:ribulose-5-phosphate 4-epimerase/fuculose-1-phosphate aldolase